MNVDQRGARLEGFMGRLDLLGRRNRQGRIVRLARHRAGDGYTDDAGRGQTTTVPAVPPEIFAELHCLATMENEKLRSLLTRGFIVLPRRLA